MPNFSTQKKYGNEDKSKRKGIEEMKQVKQTDNTCPSKAPILLFIALVDFVETAEICYRNPHGEQEQRTGATLVVRRLVRARIL